MGSSMAGYRPSRTLGAFTLPETPTHLAYRFALEHTAPVPAYPLDPPCPPETLDGQHHRRVLHLWSCWTCPSDAVSQRRVETSSDRSDPFGCLENSTVERGHVERSPDVRGTGCSVVTR